MKTHKEESVMLVSFIRPLLVGVVIGALATLLMLLLMSAGATAYDIPIAAIVPLALVANAFGALVAGFSSAKVAKRNGWLIGVLTAFILFLFTTVAGFSLYSQSDGSFLIVKALIMLACGMVGGIFAVNTGKRSYR